MSTGGRERKPLVEGECGRGVPLSIAPLIGKLIRIQGIAVGSRERFEAMNRAIAVFLQSNYKYLTVSKGATAG